VTLTVNEILQCIQGRIVNSAELGAQLDQIRVSQPASLGSAKSSDVTFFFSRAFEHELPMTQPGVLITGEPFVQPLEAARLPFWKKTAVIACQDPYLAMALISEKFAPELSTVAHIPSGHTSHLPPAQIHPTAVIASSAEIAPGVQIGPHCVVEDGVQIGSNTILYPGCYIGPQCKIGESCVLFPQVTLYEGTRVGNSVRIHSATVLGADGFGYAPKKQGRQVVGHQKIYHLGHVSIGDHVEIGAGCTIDRGTFGDTWVGPHAKIDNQVHLGHNVRVDEGAILCGGICLAGNASVGKYAYVAGMVGVINHIHVGDGAQVGAMSLVTKDVPARGTAVGNPQREYKEHFKVHAMLSRMLAERRSK
jgi:UDP-3-O-[3-hydroxymyristoyl] glucosamine N-acyltransferase